MQLLGLLFGVLDNGKLGDLLFYEEVFKRSE